jgi:hypothetical protein
VGPISQMNFMMQVSFLVLLLNSLSYKLILFFPDLWRAWYLGLVWSCLCLWGLSCFPGIFPGQYSCGGRWKRCSPEPSSEHCPLGWEQRRKCRLFHIIRGCFLKTYINNGMYCQQGEGYLMDVRNTWPNGSIYFDQYDYLNNRKYHKFWYIDLLADENSLEKTPDVIRDLVLENTRSASYIPSSTTQGYCKFAITHDHYNLASLLICSSRMAS